MLATLLAVLVKAWTVLGPLYIKFGPILLAYLFPSPMQRAVKVPQEVRDAEDKATNGDPSGLDRP